MTCDNCSRPMRAGYQQGGNVVFCLDCHEKASQIRLQAMDRSAMLINHLTETMEHTLGAPPGPRMHVPQTSLNIGTMDNSINISGSIVGAVNSGVVGSLNTSLNNISLADPKVADTLKMLAEKVGANEDLKIDLKEAALEALTFLADQGSQEPEKRNKSMIRSAITNVQTVIGTTADLVVLVPLLLEVAKHLLK